MTAAALIVAAGRGRRVGGPVPKQYRLLSGIAVLGRTLDAFLAHPDVNEVRVVIHHDDADRFERLGVPRAVPVLGGETRQASVRLGLESLSGAPPDHVLIHDGVRPFVAADTIASVLRALEREQAALACVRVADTLKRGVDGFVAGTIDRADVWRAQTPQGFRFADILAAHRVAAGSSLAEFTDDTQLAERHGMRVAIVEGHEDNFKITTEADFGRAERLLASGWNPGRPPSAAGTG